MAGLVGGSGGLRGHGELPLNADINVTSLVDVAFVLLIIFMITAPIMQGGVDVRLPRAEARPIEPKSGLVVTWTAAGESSSINRRCRMKTFAPRSRRSCAAGARPGSISVLMGVCRMPRSSRCSR